MLAFFAAQFIEVFQVLAGSARCSRSPAGRLLLTAAALPDRNADGRRLHRAWSSLGNLFIGSMSAKYAFFAPVFVPMFMQVGISPELTQVGLPGRRLGEQRHHALNPYVVILLVFMQRYVPRAGHRHAGGADAAVRWSPSRWPGR